MSFEIRESEYVAPTRGEGNPFVEHVQSIALKTKTVNGKEVPVALEFTVTHGKVGKDARRTEIDEVAQVTRQLRSAGEKTDPVVTVRSLPAAIDATSTLVKFWTVKKIERASKKVAEKVEEKTEGPTL